MTQFTSYDLAGPDPSPMTRAEVDELKRIMSLLPPEPTVIQIGAERGCSTLAMLEARPDAFIFSIDMGERPEERSNIEKAGLDHRHVVRGLGKSQDIGMFWPLEWECDLLFIDGDHRRPGIDEDINTFDMLVKHRGFIVFHDYIPNPPAHIKGRVAEAVDEWKADAIGNNYCQQVSLVDRLLTFRLT